MTIERELFELLTRIYNTFLTINTKGNDTLIMADCLRALELLIVLISSLEK